MEQNYKNCRVILEPINLRAKESSMNVKPTTPKCQKFVNKTCITPCCVKLDNLKITVVEKDISVNNSKHVQPATACFSDLENVKNKSANVETTYNKKRYKKSSCLSQSVSPNTPRNITKRRKSLPETKSTIKKSKAGIMFEPVTPQAHFEFSVELKKVLNERNILTSKTRKRVFEALDEIKTRTEEDSRRYKREKALLEIINSEIKYVHQLEIIINFFMKPTRELALLRSDDFEILFGNISTIYNINKELLEELDKGTENITYAFSKIAPYLKLYSVYAFEFRSRIKILQNARSLNPLFAKFLESQESRPEVQNKLSALLITPIQRVPRYKLLLTNLHHLTKTSENDFDSLTECLEKVEAAAEHINKVVEDQENVQRLLEFQRCLRVGEPNVIAPGRRLIKEGTLRWSTKNAHSEKLYVVLMNDIIMFNKMKKHEPKVNSLKCSSIFPLSKCKIVELLDKGCLRIICQNEELVLYHDQFSETKDWIRKITNSIENHLNDRKTLKKESSSRRPVKRKDLHEYHEVGLSPGKPLKKRKISEEAVAPITVSDKRAIKRRPPIHSMLATSSQNGTIVRSLFPPSTQTTNDIDTSQKEEPVTSKDLYVFGRPNKDTGFKFGSIVKTTFKKLFGLKS